MAQPTLLQTQSDLDASLEASGERPLLIFKHSLTCPVSSMAWQQYQEFLLHRSDDAAYALVEIQNARDVSTAIAERTGVRHESPQALLVKDGEVVWHASHWDITRDSLERALDRPSAGA